MIVLINYTYCYAFVNQRSFLKIPGSSQKLNFEHFCSISIFILKFPNQETLNTQNGFKENTQRCRQRLNGSHDRTCELCSILEIFHLHPCCSYFYFIHKYSIYAQMLIINQQLDIRRWRINTINGCRCLLLLAVTDQPMFLIIFICKCPKKERQHDIKKKLNLYRF